MGLLCFTLAGAMACGAPLPDEGLALQRGGFSLPNGIDVALSVDTQTAVDGAVVLRSVFRIDQGAPRTDIYVPRSGQVVPEANGSSGGADAGAQVRYDGRTGLQIVAAAPHVEVGDAPPIPDGLVRAGAGAVTDHGVVVVGGRDGLTTVGLRDAGLDITHLAGTAIGSAVANSASGRTVDTQTTVSIDLRNAGPDVLGSAMLQAQALVSDAVAGRVR